MVDGLRFDRLAMIAFLRQEDIRNYAHGREPLHAHLSLVVVSRDAKMY